MVYSIHYICKEFQNFQSPFMYIIWCFILTTTSYSYPSSKCRCFFNSHFILLNCLLKIAQDCYPVSYLDSRSFISFDALDQFRLVSSVQLLGCVRLFTTPWTAAHQGSLTITSSGVYPNPGPLSWWCHPTTTSSVVPFSSSPQPFPASGSFQKSQLFTSGGQSIRVSASSSVLPMNTQDWSPLGWTGWISLQSKGLSRVFSNSTVQKHQFFGAQLSSWSNSHIHTWPLEKP